MTGDFGEREQLLGTLALDEITRSRPLPLSVPMPTEKRLLALCEAVLADPASADRSNSGRRARARARARSRDCFVRSWA